MKGKSKKWMGVLLTLALVLGLLPGMSMTAGAESAHSHDGWIEWDETDSLPTTAGKYYLTEDVALAHTWTVPEGTVDLCLNGYGIQMTGNERVIYIGYTGTRTLNLYDCDNAREHYVTLSGWRGTAVSDIGTEQAVDSSGDGVVKVEGGYITGGFEEGEENGGGAVFVSGNGTNTFAMQGGTILGNKTTKSGGAIWNGGTLNIGGHARITCNYGGEGNRGGVYHGQGSGAFNISETPDLTGNSGCDIVVNGAERRISFTDFDPDARLGVVYVTGNGTGVITTGAKFSSDEEVRQVIQHFRSDRTILKNDDGQAEVVPAYKVTLSGGKNAVASGGETTQTGLTGAMDEVTYTAKAGCYFTAFADITQNGVTVMRTSATTVKVSGAPTADVSITVPDARMTPKPGGHTPSAPGQPSAPVSPDPAEATPADPTPVDPTPVDPAPVDPTPADPTPVDPTPAVRHSAPYQDVEPGAWYIDAVDYVIEKGLMNGVSDTEFRPNAPLTRAMLAAILYRMEGEPAIRSGIPFSDVVQEDWYAMAVSWAESNGIVNGYENGEFRPNRNVSREEMAAMIQRFAVYKGQDASASADLSGYTDADQIGNWAKDAMAWANAAGLITGKGDARLDPKGNTTRAEAAAILMRFCENLA